MQATTDPDATDIARAAPPAPPRKRTQAEINAKAKRISIVHRAKKYRIKIPQLLFILAYIENGCNSARRAYYSVYECATEDIAAVNASRLLTNANIIKALDHELADAFFAASINPDDILLGLSREAQSAEKSADRIRALEILGRYQSMWSDRPPVQAVTFNLQLAGGKQANMTVEGAADHVDNEPE